MQCEYLHPPVLKPEALSRLPELAKVKSLGMNAIAHVKLFSPDAPFVAYLTGFDGTDTFLGLMIAQQLQPHFGCVYQSGLEVARQVWDIALTPEIIQSPTPLWDVLANAAKSVAYAPKSAWPLRIARYRATRAQLLVNLAKDHHPMFYTAP